MSHSLQGVLAQFFYDSRLREVSAHTLKAYKLDLADFAKHMVEERERGGENAPEDQESLFEEVVNCTSVDLRRYKTYLTQKKLSTAARRFASLRKFLSWAHAKELRRKVLPEFPKLRSEQKLAPRWLTKNQVHTLLKKAEKRDHTTSLRNMVMIKLLINTGLRVSELVSLTWDEITLKRYDGFLQVLGGKGNKDRIVPLNANIRTLLEKYRNSRKNSDKNLDYLFYGGRGRLNSDAVLRMFYSLNKELDFKVTPHNLRHTFCKSLLDKGVPASEIATLAGHSSLNTTQKYITPSLADVTKSVEKLNEW